MKHLIFVTLSLTKGGAERVISNMCNDFFADKSRVTIISLMKAVPEYPLDERIRLITIDECEQDYKKSMPIRFVTRRRKLKRVLTEICAKEGKPDCIVSFLPEPNMLMCSLKKCIAVPLIISVRNDPKVEYASKLKYAMMRLLYPKSDGYVFQTKQAKEYFSFSEHITGSCVVIPNPLAKEFVEAAVERTDANSATLHNRTEEQANKTPYRVMAAGRLEKQKNYPLMLQAFEAFHAKYPDSMLTIYGEGSEREKLELWIKEKGLSECILMLGVSDRIREEMAEADLFLMTSVYEGMPNALMEAMAMGLPVIATDCPCGGPAYLIEHGRNGFLVPLADDAVGRFAEIMVRLYEDRMLAAMVAKQAREIAKTEAPDVIYKRWEEYIETIING